MMCYYLNVHFQGQRVKLKAVVFLQKLSNCEQAVVYPLLEYSKRLTVTTFRTQISRSL